MVRRGDKSRFLAEVKKVDREGFRSLIIMSSEIRKVCYRVFPPSSREISL